MAESVDAQFLQVLGRKARQDLFADLVLAECRLMPFEAQAPQPTCDVHDGAQLPLGAQSSSSPNSVSRTAMGHQRTFPDVSGMSGFPQKRPNCCVAPGCFAVGSVTGRPKDEHRKHLNYLEIDDGK